VKGGSTCFSLSSKRTKGPRMVYFRNEIERGSVNIKKNKREEKENSDIKRRNLQTERRKNQKRENEIR
jgi:hypothetical protein